MERREAVGAGRGVGIKGDAVDSFDEVKVAAGGRRWPHFWNAKVIMSHTHSLTFRTRANAGVQTRGGDAVQVSPLIFLLPFPRIV